MKKTSAYFSLLLIICLTTMGLLTGCGGGGGGSSFLPTGNVEGNVTDSSTGNPIAGVTVTVMGQSGTTDSSGNYQISGINTGSALQLKGSKAGYAGYTGSVNVKQDETTTHNFAMTQVEAWPKTYGGSYNDRGQVIIRTSDGGYAMTGYSRSSDGDLTENHVGYDSWIAKLDKYGTIKWQKSIGGSNGDFTFSLLELSDGSFVAAGYTFSNDGDVSGNNGSSDFWIYKVDSNGDLQWQKCYGGSLNDYGATIIKASDGGFLITGQSESNDGDLTGNKGDYDAWVIKLDSDGNSQWQKNYGGTQFDSLNSVRQTSDGGYILVGCTKSNDGDVSGNNGNQDNWMVKLNSSGVIQWQKCFGGSENDYSEAIRITSDGGYVVGGSTASNNGDVSGNNGAEDFWITKHDSTGNIEWQKCFGGSKTDYAWSIEKTSDGGFIAIGQTESSDGDVTENNGEMDYWAVKLDSTGTMEWQQSMGGSLEDLGRGACVISDGFLFIGHSYSDDGDVSNNHGLEDFWIMKLSLTGAK